MMEQATNQIKRARMLLLIPMLGCLVSASSQTFCDSIFIEHVQYNAVNAQQIEVSAMTISPNNCFGYPTFVLYDQNGDTLARETVGFFCLGVGNFQTHMMDVLPGAVIPQSPFTGTLELFSGFGDTLVCSWQMSFNICPPDSCIQAELYVTDLHSQLSSGPLFWYMYDNAGLNVGSGIFDLDGVNHTHFDTICLAPGSEYNVWLSPFAPIDIFDSVVLGVTSSYQRSIGTNTYQQNDSTREDLFFDWYEECADFTNNVPEAEDPTFTVFQSGDILLINTLDEMDVDQLELMNVQGQIIQRMMTTGHRNEININGTSSGPYVVRMTDRSGFVASKLIIIQ